MAIRDRTRGELAAAEVERDAVARRHSPPDTRGALRNGRRVGSLRKLASGGTEFRSGPDWLAWARASPVSLSRRLRASRFVGRTVFAVLDGLLPDHVDLSRSVAKEHLCMRLIAAFGLPTASVEVPDTQGCQALGAKRFDRLWTKSGGLLRPPKEDCCQALSAMPARQTKRTEVRGCGRPWARS